MLFSGCQACDTVRATSNRETGHMRAVILALTAGVLTAGCQTAKPINQMSFAELNVVKAGIVKRCADEGFGPSHPRHQSCVNHETIREITTREAAREQQRRFADALGNFGDALAAADARRPITTNCSRTHFGGMDCTTW